MVLASRFCLVSLVCLTFSSSRRLLRTGSKLHAARSAGLAQPLTHGTVGSIGISCTDGRRNNIDNPVENLDVQNLKIRKQTQAQQKCFLTDKRHSFTNSLAHGLISEFRQRHSAELDRSTDLPKPEAPLHTGTGNVSFS